MRARIAASVVGRGCPMAIALPRSRATRAAVRSWDSIYAASARLSKKTSRVAVGMPASRVGGRLAPLVVVHALCQRYVREIGADLGGDLCVAHLRRDLPGAGVEPGERLHRQMQHHALAGRSSFARDQVRVRDVGQDGERQRDGQGDESALGPQPLSAIVDDDGKLRARRRWGGAGGGRRKRDCGCSLRRRRCSGDDARDRGPVVVAHHRMQDPPRECSARNGEERRCRPYRPGRGRFHSP